MRKAFALTVVRAGQRHFLKIALAGSALMAGLVPAGAQTLPASVLGASLGGIDQPSRRLSDWNGKLRVVNFWATWCAPCRSEIPVLQSAADQWQKDAVVIGVALDNAKDVRRFSREAGIRYPLLLAPQQGGSLMQGAGNVSGALPYTVLVDGQGTVLQRHAGPITANQLDGWLREAVAKKRSSHAEGDRQ